MSKFVEFSDQIKILLELLYHNFDIEVKIISNELLNISSISKTLLEWNI
jgi:hypothetical protein